MSTKKKHVWHLKFEALLVKVFFDGFGFLFRRLPWHLTTILARMFARIVSFFPLRKKVIDENLLIAFPEYPKAKRDQIAVDARYHTFLFAIELAHLWRAEPDDIKKRIEIDPETFKVAQTFHQEGGGIILSAHMGNWEWLGAWYAITFGNFGVVYKPMHNPYTDAIACQLRKRFGIKIFSTRDRTPRALIQHLQQGGTVAILADQDARQQGQFYPFFGRPASTATGPASLAFKLNRPILPGFCFRTPEGKLKIKDFPLLNPNNDLPIKEAQDQLMRGYLASVEEMIRTEPAQYFWWHRRWKTQPKLSLT